MKYMKTKSKKANSVELARKKIFAFLCGMLVLSIISFINDGFIWKALFPAITIAAPLLVVKPSWLNWIVICLDAINVIVHAIYMASVFYLIITPLSFIYKPIFMTKMRVKPSYKHKSYWCSVNNKQSNSCNYDKQY